MRGKGADRFQYELTVEDGEVRRELIFSEDRVPEALRPLLDRVRAPGSE
jgi:hypothetical protein